MNGYGILLASDRPFLAGKGSHLSCSGRGVELRILVMDVCESLFHAMLTQAREQTAKEDATQYTRKSPRQKMSRIACGMFGGILKLEIE